MNPLPVNPLSAVLITRNAAAILEPCLDSLAFADEIVVVDSASTDATAELAARKGARVVQKEWLGFGRQKQFAVEQARNDWVLCVDADERVSPQLAASIRAALAADLAGLPHGEAQPLPRPLARARRGVPRLEP
ncbi:MAG TPA: glycosyltransferase family 2 protein, partial [Burkholderiales bacterium]|nr:glycosyltransferase family 2 protein [Burkholderiales bacterium]